MRTDTGPSGGTSRADLIWVSAALAGVLLWRLRELGAQPEPVGVDMANWVRTFQSWRGLVDIDDVVIPPLGPAVGGIVNELLGLRWTSHILMPVAALAPAIGVWIVLRSVGTILRLTSTVAVALAGSTSSAMAWGGLPQLVGIGLFVVGVEQAVRFGEQPTRRRALAAGALLATVAATSSLVTIHATVALLLVVATSVAAHRWAAGRTLVWLVTPCLPLLPLYAVMAVRMSVPSDAATNVGVRDAVSSTFGPNHWPWIVLLAVSTLEVGRRLARERSGIPLLGVALLAGAAVPTLSGELRFAYVLPSTVVVVAAIVGSGTGIALRSVIVVALLAVAVTGASSQHGEIERYARLVPAGSSEAVAWLSSHVDDHDLVLSPPVEGAPFGWVVEAEGIDALVASRPDWLFFPRERAQSARAAGLLSGPNWPTDRDLAEIRTAGVDWIVLPIAWGGFEIETIDAIAGRCPDRVPYRTVSFVILKPDVPCP